MYYNYISYTLFTFFYKVAIIILIETKINNNNTILKIIISPAIQQNTLLCHVCTTCSIACTAVYVSVLFVCVYFICDSCMRS